MINIITRTSNRPTHFKRLLESIDKQTYKKVNHIVINDNNDSYAIERDALQVEKIPRTAKKNGYFYHAPYNLYFNQIKQLNINPTIYLDDDDQLASNHALETIVEQFYLFNIDVLFFQFSFQNRIIPKPDLLESIVHDRYIPKVGEIGGSCFAFGPKAFPIIEWDEWSCSDQRVIAKLILNPLLTLGYVNDVMASTQTGAHGGQLPVIP